jgi:hypothetical protein
LRVRRPILGRVLRKRGKNQGRNFFDCLIIVCLVSYRNTKASLADEGSLSGGAMQRIDLVTDAVVRRCIGASKVWVAKWFCEEASSVSIKDKYNS